MSNQAAEETLNDNEEEEEDLSEEWETMARAWLCSFPEPKALSMAEIEAWIDSNHDSLPRGIKSMPRSDLSQRLLSIQLMRLPHQVQEEVAEEPSQTDIPQARFQRTDQWLPVYSWLESLDRDEVVKSKDISDWLAASPSVQDELCSRHSRYHLMHYIKKCHMKILKRKERSKGLRQSEKRSSLKVNKDVVMRKPAPQPPPPPPPPPQQQPIIDNNYSISLTKDNDPHLTKRKEALQKYQILVELEKLIFPALKRQRS